MENQPYAIPATGNYEFQIRRTSSADSDLIARSPEVQVRMAGTDAAPSPAADPNWQADTTSTRTGATRGEFRVTESGAASYRIPIMTAPSGGGMAPEIALSYNSQAGPGSAGIGWNLEGLSAITRCAQTWETDDQNGGVTLTESDRFCLDGQRLIVIAGTYGADGAEYRLEVDQIVRIQSFGSQGEGPAYFKVWRKDGTVSWYGATEASGVDLGKAQVSSKLSGPDSEALRWNIGRIEDSASNFMRFEWSDLQSLAVETVLDKVVYGGNVQTGVAPDNVLNFSWDAVPAAHRTEGYLAGIKLIASARLSQITSTSGNQVLRHYHLHYNDNLKMLGNSALASVQECNGSHCFEPTGFEWNEADLQFSSSSVSAPLIQNTDKVEQLQLIDVNGDGLSDIVWVEKRSGANPPLLHVRLAALNSAGEVDYLSAAPTTMDPQTGSPDSPSFEEQSGNTVRVLSDHFETFIVDDPIQFQMQPNRAFDANGDGQADLVFLLRLRRCVANCPILAEDPESGGLAGEELSLPHPIHKVYSRYILFQSQADPADGQVEFVSAAILGTSYEDDATIGHPEIEHLQVVDLNRDGLGDLVYYNADAQVWQFRLNRGFDGEFEAARTIHTSDSNGWPAHEDLRNQLQIIDADGDGHPDALFPSSRDSDRARWKMARWKRELNAGSGGFASPEFTAALAKKISRNQTQFADLYGDGKLDQVLFGPFGNSNINIELRYGVNTQTLSSRHEPQGSLRRVTDGFGAWTELNYRSLVQPEVYQRGGGGPVPEFGGGSVVYDVTVPMYVVSTATSLSPQYELGTTLGGNTTSSYRSNGTTRVQYFYSGARIQGGGRGFLGFRGVASYDPQSGMLTQTRYHQDFPFIGLPEATRSWHMKTDPWSSIGAPSLPNWIESSCVDWSTGWSTGNEIFLGCSENIWSEVFTAQANGLTHPYLARSGEWSFNPDYSGTNLSGASFSHRVVTENTQLDGYGNVGQVSVSTYTSISGIGDPVASRVSANHYSDDASRWHLGRLSCSTVQSTRGNQTTQRRSTFGYHSATGILNRETVNASSCLDSSGSLATTYALDSFGNRTTTTVTGTEINPARRTRVTYDPRGRYVDTEQVQLGTAWLTTSEVLDRDHYGNALRVRNGQNVTAVAGFDAMGRPHYSYTPDGAWTRVLHRPGGHANCPSGTASREELTAADGSRSWVCKDVLGRETRAIVWGFDGQRIYTDTRYDYASRPLEVSEPYFPGDPIYWTRTFYDEVGRVEFVELPDGNTESWRYNLAGSGLTKGLRTTHTNARGKQHVTDRNALGEKIGEIAADLGTTNYRYDALGQLIETDGPLADDTIVIAYDALGNKKRLDDPDKGTWHYRHNALGDLICQRDAKNQGTLLTYDGLGRRIGREDLVDVFSTDTCAGTPVGNTNWGYGNTVLEPEFGQIVFESSQYDDGAGANHTTLRSYYYRSQDGRLIHVDTTIAEAGGFNRSYSERTTYDPFGRVFQQFDAAGGDRGTQFTYNSFGYLQRLEEARRGDGLARLAYWTVVSQNARGQITEAVMGNGASVTAGYDPATGRLRHKVDDSDFALVQDLQLAWDAVGNVTHRHDQGGLRDQFERFEYDARDRLTRVRMQRDGGPETTALQMRYDRSGNIVCKSDVSSLSCALASHSNYNYGAGSAGPHAVTQAGARTIFYDANGNVGSDQVGDALDREFHYTSYDKVRRISRSSDQVEFHYGADRSRTLRRDLSGTQVEQRTHYVGSVEVIYRGHNPGPGGGEYRRYIGGIAIATFFEASGIDRQRYLHTDHIGSTIAITDENGQVVANMAFDAWGERRRAADWTDQWVQWLTGSTPAWAQSTIAITPRGYTGHEHVDSMGIIHMNGRIYDAHLGRFLQADPFVEDSTTLNRYTYVHNNPLALTDPSGFFSFGGFAKKLGKALSALGQVVRLLPCQYCQTAGEALIGIGQLLRHFGTAISSLNQSSAPGTLPGAFSSSFQVEPFSPLQDSTPQQQREVHEAMRSLMPGLSSGVIAAVASERNGHAFATAGAGDVQFQRKPEDRSAEIATNVSLSGTDSVVTDAF
ncbi:MAG: FG-GAP-like repeat-containing protein [Xanthomonadaceae bacterium]|nr:FG-GAP-like repeat-containing protein [Xanthomonadaceae bacterium]